jgi:hypothetical protein
MPVGQYIYARDNSDFFLLILVRAAEQLGWEARPAGQQKRLEDLALPQELVVA